MILSFKTKWASGEPNYFPHLIWNSIISGAAMKEEGRWPLYARDREEYSRAMFRLNGNRFDEPGDDHHAQKAEKIHTIRSGKRQWKEGHLIHPYAGRYTDKGRFQIAPTLVCTGVQKIVMKWPDPEQWSWPYTYIIENGKERAISGFELLKLAVNDGFPGVEEFSEYFFPGEKDVEYTGTIIHWTEHRY